MKRLVLLDRDGTIIVERHYLSAPDQVELLPGAAEGIRLLKELELAVVVVTNQSGIGRGYFDQGRLEQIHQRMSELLARQGAAVDGIFTCPHRPDETCACRKPAPGLAYRAAAEMKATLTNAFVIGDKPCDIELGQRVSATTILVRTGYGAAAERTGTVSPDYTAEDLLEAANLIRDAILRNGDEGEHS